MTLFNKEFRIESSRLKNWDYSSNGAYYVTICVDNRECVFGKIIEEKIELSNIGKIADQYWQEIPDHFPFVQLDEYVIMPNHLHGIIIIDKPKIQVETQNLTSLSRNGKNKFGPQSKNIGSIVRGFKIGVTKYALENSIHFKWQSRFFDHVIFDYVDMHNIRQYIIKNPKNWKEDEFYKK